MGLKLDFCDDADMFRVFSIISDAFGDEQPYMDVLFPNHKTAEGRAQGRDRLLQIKHHDPHARFLKVTDTDTGEIIGHARWLVYEDKPTKWDELSGDYWQDEDEKALAAHLYTGYLKPRRAAIQAAKGPLVCVSFPLSLPIYAANAVLSDD